MHTLSTTRHKNNTQAGFTLVELIVGMAVTGLLSIAIVSLIVVWLQQYAVNAFRNTMTLDTQTVIRNLNDDIRNSTKLLATNAVSDPNAPVSPGSWVSNSTQLVLAQTPRNSAGAGLYTTPSTYTGTPNSIVYYLQSGALYRRVVPVGTPAATYGTNIALPLVTCVSAAAGGCPTDQKIIGNIKTLSFTYYTNTGAITTTAASAKSVVVTISLEQQKLGQTITTTNSARMTFRL